MPVAVQTFQRRKEKEGKSAVSEVLEGVGLANAILGLTNKAGITDTTGENAAREQQLAANKQALAAAQDAQRRNLEGTATMGDILNQQMAGNVEPAQAGEKGSFAVPLDIPGGREGPNEPVLLKRVPKGISALELARFGIQQRAEKRDIARDKLAREKDLLNIDKSKKSLSSKYTDRVESLGAEEKKRLDNVVLAKQTVNKMAEALMGGSNTFSIKGENSYTLARNLFKEAIVRMQSGGAINEKEAKDFLNLPPTAFDSPEIQKEKMNILMDVMNQRLETFGIDLNTVPSKLKFFSPIARKYSGGKLPVATDELKQMVGNAPSIPVITSSGGKQIDPSQKSIQQAAAQKLRERLANENTASRK